MRKERASSKRDTRTNPQADFRALPYRLLECASKGSLRAEFLREALSEILEFLKCDAIELWFIEDEKVFRCEAQRGAMPGFNLERLRKDALPSPRGDVRVPQVPVIVGSDQIGLLQLRADDSRDAYFKDLLKEVAQSLGYALVHSRMQVSLRERIKELSCLYGIAQTAARPGLSFDDSMQQIVELLPPAWLYPEIAVARIILPQRQFTTPGFTGHGQKLSADILVNGKRRGAVEVVYREERPELDEGPFLKEERSLLNAVSRELGLIVERRDAEHEKSRVEAQLRHADRLATVGQLAAGVAHELNEPLGSILGFAQLAQKGAGLPLQARQDLDKIIKASLHAREIIRQLLTFSRQTPPQKARLDLNSVVEEVCALLAARCKDAGVGLVSAATPELPRVTADRGQLLQVLVNLVVNAIQASPNGGIVTIQTVASREYVALSVTDSGTGMTPEVLKQIFVPFFTTKGLGQGTGLGLPVVHGIVTAHGGVVRVTSAPGQGSRFEVRLPRDANKPLEDGSLAGL